MKALFDDEVANRYDGWFLSPAGRYVEQVENDLLLDLLRPRPGQTLLDVGCGTGNHLLLLRQRGLDVCGLDPSEAMLRVARDKLGPAVDLRVGMAEDLPYEDNSFDIVTLISCLEFSPHPFRALAEAFRVARGHVLVAVLNRLSANGVQRKLEGLFRPTLYRHARFYSVLELRYMVRRVLGVSRVEWGSVIWLPLRFHRWDGLVGRWMPRRMNPFGAFLAMRIEILYTHQAAMNPLTTAWMRTRPEASPGTAVGRVVALRRCPP